MSQLDLNGATELALTARQDAVWQAVRRHPDGVTADEAGAAAHTVPGPRGGRTHNDDVRCDFCAREGRRLLDQLVARGLVRRRRGGERGIGYLYVVADTAELEDTRAWSISDEIPF